MHIFITWDKRPRAELVTPTSDHSVVLNSESFTDLPSTMATQVWSPVGQAGQTEQSI